jgi:hypothetical protein
MLRLFMFIVDIVIIYNFVNYYVSFHASLAANDHVNIAANLGMLLVMAVLGLSTTLTLLLLELWELNAKIPNMVLVESSDEIEHAE